MKIASFFLFMVFILDPVKLFGTEFTLSENPEHFLKWAIEGISESREPANYAEYQLLLQLSRDIVCFDRTASTKLLAKAFEVAKSTEEQVKRLNFLEMLALYASPINRKLSTDALLLVKIPKDYQIDLCIQLKLLAIEFVLAHRQGLGRESEVLLNAERFCKKNKIVRKSDVLNDSSYAFADYVSLLEPELGKEIWTRMCPDRAWEKRLEIAEDLIHYAPESAVPELQSLLSSGRNKEFKIKVAVALYYAGQKAEARTAIARLTPEGAGRGQPLGDLIDHVAHSDPNEAARIALVAGHGTRIVLESVATTQPKQISSFLKHTDRAYTRSYALRLAAQSLAKEGDLGSAMELADAIRVGEQRCLALATIGEVSKNPELINEAIQIGLDHDLVGRSLQAVTASAIRALGVDEGKKMLLMAVPNLQKGWQDIRMFPMLLVVAQLDPYWALQAFRCGPAQEPRRNETVVSHSVSRLLPKLAPVDPAFVEKYLTEHGKAEHPQTLVRLKKECVDEIAKESVSEAKKFAERINLSAQAVDDRRLTFLYRTWQIVKSPQRVNQILEKFKLRDTSDKRRLVLEAAEMMIGWQEDYFRDIKGVVELAEELKDKSLADEVLSNASRLLFQLHQEKESLELLNRIQSPWQRAKALEWIAHGQLSPRPRERHSFLQGCEANEAY